MQVSKKQMIALKGMDARLNILDGSVRSGKTVISLLKWIEYIKYGPKGSLIMIGKTERTLKRNILDPLVDILGSGVRYNQGKGELYIGRRLVYVGGANDEKAEGKIRGMTLAGAYGDEVSLWPESLFKMLLSRLSIEGAKLFVTTNPDSPYHWLKEGFIDNEKLNLYHMHFCIDDNPFLSKQFKMDLKKEFTGLWYKRFIDGLWVMADGIVYDMFNPDIHIKAPKNKEFSNYIIACDYATGNPFTTGLYGWDYVEDGVYLVSEYYYDSVKSMKQKTDSQYEIEVSKWFKEQNVDRNKLLATYIDPSALSFINEMKQKGWPVREACNDVLDGIRFTGNMLGQKRFFIHPECRETLKEFTSYVWDPKAQAKGEDKPIKKDDHCMDRNRYALYSHFGSIKLAGAW